jgi:hypothetical protein
MSDYILTLLAASLAVAVIELLSPKGEGGRIVSHVRLVAGLFLLVLLLDPLRRGLSLLRQTADGDLTLRLDAAADLTYDSAAYDRVFQNTLAAAGKGEVETWVRNTLCTEFAIPPSDCAVEAVCAAEGGEITLLELRIGLSGAHRLQNPHPIEAFFSEKFDCACYVTVVG